MTLKAPHGPVETEIKVHIISDDGEARGVATIGLGFGQYATPAVIAARIDEFEKNDLPRLAPGYRLQTAQELFDTACLEKAGETYATPKAWMSYQPPE